MINKSFLIILLSLSNFALAESVWISNDLRTGVLKAPDDGSSISTTVVAGETVEKIGVSKDGRFVHIRTQNNQEGWVRARSIMNTPSIRANYDSLQKELSNLEQEVSNASEKGASSQRKIDILAQALSAAKEQAKNAHDELLQLKRASENVVAIDQLNKELQTKVATLEQNNMVLSQQNAQLKATQDKKEMITGGGLVLGGMLLFWLLSMFMVAQQRRHSSFDDF